MPYALQQPVEPDELDALACLLHRAAVPGPRVPVPAKIYRDQAFNLVQQVRAGHASRLVDILVRNRREGSSEASGSDPAP